MLVDIMKQVTLITKYIFISLLRNDLLIQILHPMVHNKFELTSRGAAQAFVSEPTQIKRLSVPLLACGSL